jgi:hypothetical protein
VGPRTLVQPSAQNFWCSGGKCSFDTLVASAPSTFVPQPFSAQGVVSAIAAEPPAASLWESAPKLYAHNFSGHDIGAKINAACASIEGPPRIVQVDAIHSTVTTPIRPTSGCWVRGSGMTRTLLQANTSGNPNSGGLGTQQVFRVGDPSGAVRVQNVRISNLAITNGIPDPNGIWSGMDAIRADGCDHCTFDHLSISSIQGNYGIVFKSSDDVYVSDNIITKFDSTGIMALSGSSKVWIERNFIDTAMVQTNAPANAYGIGIGSEDTILNAGFTDNGNVLNNEVRNIPSWECYDSHGGTNRTFDGNYGLNCYFGMQFGVVAKLDTAGGQKYDVLSALVTTNNYVDRGNGLPNGYGVVLSGSGTGLMVKGALVQGNTARGYGGAACPSGSGPDCAPNLLEPVGAITFYDTVDTQILDNRIPTYYQGAIELGAQNWNGAVLGNWAGDILGAVLPSPTMILFGSIGNWGTLVDNNSMGPSSPALAPAHFLVNEYQANEISLGPNNSAALYPFPPPSNAWSGVVPVWWPQPSVLLNYQPNDVGYFPYPQQAYPFAVPSESYYSAATTVGSGGADGSKSYYSKDTTDVIATGSIANGSGVVTALSGNPQICNSAAYWYYCLPPGMHIVLTPAAGTGAPFAAKIIGNDGTQLTLDTTAPSDMPAATITYQDGTAGP